MRPNSTCGSEPGSQWATLTVVPGRTPHPHDHQRVALQGLWVLAPCNMNNCPVAGHIQVNSIAVCSRSWLPSGREFAYMVGSARYSVPPFLIPLTDTLGVSGWGRRGPSDDGGPHDDHDDGAGFELQYHVRRDHQPHRRQRLQQIVTTMRSVQPSHFLFDWNGATGFMDNGQYAITAYPGECRLPRRRLLRPGQYAYVQLFAETGQPAGPRNGLQRRRQRDALRHELRGDPMQRLVPKRDHDMAEHVREDASWRAAQSRDCA